MAAEQGKETRTGHWPTLNIERIYSTTLPAGELAQALAEHFRAKEFEAQVFRASGDRTATCLPMQPSGRPRSDNREPPPGGRAYRSGMPETDPAPGPATRLNPGYMLEAPATERPAVREGARHDTAVGRPEQVLAARCRDAR